MSKKKNTLKDLDEFLKQQAATLVSPSRLSEQPEASEPIKAPEVTVEKVQEPFRDKVVSASNIIKDLKHLSLTKGDAFKDEFCSIILAVMDGQTEHSPEDKMLINTALYLKHGSNWKEEIRTYWKNKKS
jgi:hypothetical protein